MNRSDYITFLEEALDTQRLGQRLHIGLAITVMALGLLAIIMSQLFPGVVVPDNQKLLGVLGGSFISTLSAFPIKQITERRARIAALRFLLTGFRHLELDEKPDGDEQTQLEDRFWKLMDASLGK